MMMNVDEQRTFVRKTYYSLYFSNHFIENEREWERMNERDYLSNKRKTMNIFVYLLFI